MPASSKDRVWIGRELQPDVAISSAADARKVAADVQQVDDQLKVQVRRPPTVDVRGSNRADRLAGLTTRCPRASPVSDSRVR